MDAAPILHDFAGSVTSRLRRAPSEAGVPHGAGLIAN